MIDFRYHVVSIVAVFLALALGLFLGSTTLQGRVFDDLKGRVHTVTQNNDQLRAQVRAAQDQVHARDAFDRALLPAAVAGRLSGQTVVVVSAPGVDDGMRKQVMAALTAAGGTVSADVRLQPALLDPKQQAFLASLAQRVNVPTPALTPGADGSVRAADQLAAALGTRPAGRKQGTTTTATVLDVYSAAKLISVARTASGTGADLTPHAGTLALVLSGPAPSATADPAVTRQASDVMTALLEGLDTTALGAVLAGPTPADGAGPDLVSSLSGVSAVSHKVSTVTGADTPDGQIATVFALAAQVDGVVGSFGLAPSHPSPLPSTSGSP